MKKIIFLATFLAFTQISYAQKGYGTNNPDPLSIIHLESSNKAFYLPRLTDGQIAAQTGWKSGMIVYNTDKNCLYQRTASAWQCVDRASEPWFGTDDNAAATSNTENIYHNGNVGISTTAPTQALDVDGQVRIRKGNPGTEKVITSVDSIGTAEWKTPEAFAYASQELTASTHVKPLNNAFYTGTKLTLGPGRWAIDVTMLLWFCNSAGNQFVVPDGHGYWITSTFTESSTSSTATSNFLGAEWYSSAVSGPTPFGLNKGVCIIENTTSSDKDYFYWFKIAYGWGGAPLNTVYIKNFGTKNWGENTIYISKINSNL